MATEVMCKKGVKQWAKHASLGDLGVNKKGGGRVPANSHTLCAINKKIHHPIA